MLPLVSVVASREMFCLSRNARSSSKLCRATPVDTGGRAVPADAGGGPVPVNDQGGRGSPVLAVGAGIVFVPTVAGGAPAHGFGNPKAVAAPALVTFGTVIGAAVAGPGDWRAEAPTTHEVGGDCDVVPEFAPTAGACSPAVARPTACWRRRSFGGGGVPTRTTGKPSDGGGGVAVASSVSLSSSDSCGNRSSHPPPNTNAGWQGPCVGRSLRNRGPPASLSALSR